jgi:hypothetical protein
MIEMKTTSPTVFFKTYPDFCYAMINKMSFSVKNKNYLLVSRRIDNAEEFVDFCEGKFPIIQSISQKAYLRDSNLNEIGSFYIIRFYIIESL